MRSAGLVIASRVLRQIVRDRRSLIVILLQPLLIMGIFGYAFGGDVHGADLVVANLDRGTFAQDVLAKVDLETVDLIYVETEAQAEQAVRDGRTVLGVVFPTNFSENLRSGATSDPQTAYLIVFEDNTNTQVRAAVHEALFDAFDDALEDRFDRDPAFALDEHIVFGSEDPESLEFLVPGIVAYSIFMLGSMLTTVAIVKERSTGTMDRLLSTRAKRSHVVTGYALAYGALSIAQAGSILAVALLVFRVPLRGSIALALATTCLVGVVALGLGILVSGVAKNETQAIQTTLFVAFPNLFLAGIFAPFEAMPTFLRPLSLAIPLTYAVQALRAIVNRGATLPDVLPHILILAAFAASFLAVATVTFRQRS